MKPITPVLPSAPGPEDVLVWAKTQPQYNNLPSVVSADGMVTTRWSLTLRERIRLLIHGSLWLQILTFNTPLQPVKLLVDEPEVETIDRPWSLNLENKFLRKQPEIPSDEAIADALHRQVQLGHPIGSALKNRFPPE